MAKSNKAPAFHQPMLFDTASPQSAPTAPPNPIAPSAPIAQASPIAQPAPTTSEAPTPPKSNSSPNPGDLVVLVDSHSLIYQVFHALPPMTSPHGVEVGAVHGFLRDVSTLLQQWKPTYLICAFDASEETFRNKLYPEYKAHREEMPDALRGQIGLIQQALELLGIPILSIGGFEADDILATLAHQASNSKARVLLVTSDKDCRQLINPLVSMLNIRKNELFGEKELMETWAIRPDQVVDFQAMVGDSVDNVPGVPSIGPKAAQQLLAQFDSLDNIYANIQKVAGDKKREKLVEHRDQAYLSQQLVRLSLDTPVPNDWSHLQRSEPNPQKLEELFRDFGFRRLAETLLQSTRSNQVSEPSSSGAPNLPVQSESTQYLQSNHRRRLPTDNYRCVNDLTMLEQLIGELSTCQSSNDKWIAIDTETTSTKARQAQLVGISLAWGPGQAAYIPILSPNPNENLPIESVRSHLAPLLADPNYRWIGQNIKFDLLVLRSHQMPLNNVAFDTMVADYLLDAGGRWLEVDSVPITELIGTGKSQKTMDKVPLDLVAHYACEDVDIPVQIAGEMLSRLKSENLDSVLYNLELPLIDVLASMEFLGVAIDLDRLAALKADFQSRLDAIHSEVLELAGETFNPDSPKQLSAILFDKLKLRVVKKTKTGLSTDAEVLEELAAEHPLPAKLLEYRQLSKLLSTYVDALPALVNPTSNRVHTSYRQDIAATGRLSSVEPNLQNIPVRTPEGKSIRSAFISGYPNWKLLTADYSQIELRVLAHCSNDEAFCNAFRSGVDIHAAVAAKVHGVALEDVTSSMRRSAKAVSFGILYGQSPFGLAKALGISREDATRFIDEYFAQYPNVRNFIAETLIDCRKNGFVKTLSGRKRILKGVRDFETLEDNKRKQLLEPERMAINTVIQGTAADMIKLAMIAIDRELKSANLQANMLLQIHDELVFEVAPNDIDALAALVRRNMETVMPLNVPVQVDIKTGKNWAECEPL
jgi:DNA polymerase-1